MKNQIQTSSLTLTSICQTDTNTFRVAFACKNNFYYNKLK